MFTITSKIKLYAGIGLAVVFISLLGYSGYKTMQANAQQAQIATLKEDVLDLKVEIDSLKEEIIRKSQSDAKTEEVKEKVVQAVKEVEQAKTQAQVYVENKLKEIEAKYAKKEQSAQMLEQKQVEISLERARGLWLSYCLQIKEDALCKESK